MSGHPQNFQGSFAYCFSNWQRCWNFPCWFTHLRRLVASWYQIYVGLVWFRPQAWSGRCCGMSALCVPAQTISSCFMRGFRVWALGIWCCSCCSAAELHRSWQFGSGEKVVAWLRVFSWGVWRSFPTVFIPWQSRFWDRRWEYADPRWIRKAEASRVPGWRKWICWDCSGGPSLVRYSS